MQVWDLATRLYHWIQAFIFIGIMATGFVWDDAHLQLGLVLFTLTVWRILWGVYGSETSRFKQFIYSPKAILNYLLGRSTSKVGHNPIGGLMVIILIASLLLQCISGMALAGLLDQLPQANLWLTDDVFSRLESIHFVLARALPFFVFLHLGAILFYKFKGKPLVKAMITGVQSQIMEQQSVNFVSNRRAFLMLVFAGFVTMTIIAFSMV